MLKLNIIRGISGSGKTTFARYLNLPYVEADMYFYQNGIYNYDKSKIKLAHEFCYNTCVYYLKNNISVSVANTFIRYFELKPYLHLKSKFN